MTTTVLESEGVVRLFSKKGQHGAFDNEISQSQGVWGFLLSQTSSKRPLLSETLCRRAAVQEKFEDPGKKFPDFPNPRTARVSK